MHMNPRKEDKQQSKSTCIMCLAVLSGLLNFIRVGLSTSWALASFDGGSTGLVAVVKHLLWQAAVTKDQWLVENSAPPMKKANEGTPNPCAEADSWPSFLPWESSKSVHNSFQPEIVCYFSSLSYTGYPRKLLLELSTSASKDVRIVQQQPEPCDPMTQLPLSVLPPMMETEEGSDVHSLNLALPQRLFLLEPWLKPALLAFCNKQKHKVVQQGRLTWCNDDKIAKETDSLAPLQN